MPTVSEQFGSYREFASASLEDIYGARLAKAYRVEANQLESGVWVNVTREGEPIEFRWLSLPFEVQLSPVNAIASADFDGDGKMELALAQNQFSNQPETGLWRGNPGCHLEWETDRFRVIHPAMSGLHLPNDTRAILSVDTDGDGWQDLIAGQNQHAVLLFHNRGR